MSEKILIDKAIEAMKNSYSPYSDFKVGAALLGKSGKIYTGCNVENSSLSATVCAERTAIAKAVSMGETAFSAVAVVGGKKGEIIDFCPPCGICRQMFSEFCDGSFKILLFNGKDIKTFTQNELLPFSFGSENLCL